jgi:hypothetical protein
MKHRRPQKRDPSGAADFGCSSYLWRALWQPLIRKAAKPIKPMNDLTRPMIYPPGARYRNFGSPRQVEGALARFSVGGRECLRPFR